MKKRVIIFASGNGTNTQNIIKYFENSKRVAVVCVLSNNKNAMVLERSAALHVEALAFTKAQMLSPQGVLRILKNRKPDLIVLAGFLLKFPEIIIDAFPNKVINIHPALLPKFGGKGMYGAIIHDKVMENNEKETGITMHYVSEHYDSGQIIFQKKISIEDFDTAKTIEEKIHKLEYEYYPKIIETVI